MSYEGFGEVKLKKAPETIIDKTGISYEISEHQIVKEEFENPYEIADPKIKLINRLVEVGANEFNHKKLSDAIKRGNRFKNPVDNIKLIDYFYNHINAITVPADKSDWMKVLNETPFLLDNDNNLQEPPALYFPRDKPELPFELPMTFLNETIYFDRIEKEQQLEDWLCQLKVAFPEPIEIIRNGLFPLIDKKEINNQNTIAITQYLFEHKDKLEASDRAKLSLLPLLTKGNSMYEATFCYLADECEPNLAVEQYIKDDIFVSPRYLVDSTDLDGWKAFWLSLNVRQDMDLELHEAWYDFNNLKLDATYTDYTKFLKPFLPIHNERVTTSLFSLLIPRYIEYSNSYPFALQYWQLLLNKRWNELIKKCDKAKFRHSAGTVSVPSYFEFLIKSNCYFPATNGKCYKTGDVCSQSLQDIVKDWKPISYFELASSQEKLLGIKSQLSLDDCMAILDSIANSTGELDKERITALYKYILNHFDEEAIKNSLESADNLQFLAINNSFQSIVNLQYFNLPKFAGKADLADFIFLDLDKNDALNFCKLLGIKVINEDDLELQTSPNTVNNHPFNSEWELKLPYIAVVSSFKKGNNYETELTQLKEKTEETKFNPSSNLSLILMKDEEIIYEKEVSAWQKDNDVYYAHNWKDKRVIFEFSEVLCNYFDIKETERELELILNLVQNDVYDWLGKQGFDVSILTKTPPPEIVNEPPVEQTDVKILEVDVIKPTISVGLSSNRIKTEPKEDIVITKEDIVTIKEDIVIIKEEEDTVITKEDADYFGRWGENYVHENNIIGNYYQQTVSVIWLNEKEESKCPYDFEVILDNGIKHYWEVKTTPSATKAEFPISSNEIQFALDNSEVYFIVRVFNAEKEENSQHRIWANPIELIKNGKIKISDVKMEIID